MRVSVPYPYVGSGVSQCLSLIAPVKKLYLKHPLEPGSSVSVVSGYGLDDRAIEVLSPAEARDLSFNL
jgi:hypothetical protein